MCSIPSVFYPTTVFLIDDNEDFLKAISVYLGNKYAIQCFTNATKALEKINTGDEHFAGRDFLQKRFGDDFFAPRKEMLNLNRFRRHAISVLDYEMPNLTGGQITKISGTVDYEQNRVHFYILCSGRTRAKLEEMHAQGKILCDFVTKGDLDILEQIKEKIDKLHEQMFQSLGLNIAVTLAQMSIGSTSFFFVWSFLPIWNAYFKENDICEGYLFDKQGSMVFLDRKGNLRWFIVRNEYGIKHEIEKALEYGAPEKIVNALRSKEYILSLYEDEDFKNKQHIQWDKYLLKANVFKDEALESDTVHHRPATYYYAFTSDFPEHGIPTDDILSYQSFLKKNDQINQVTLTGKS